MICDLRFAICDCRKAGKLSFTLIEMLTVVAIIAVLIGLFFPSYNYAKKQARMAVARQDMSNIKTSLLAFRQEYGYFPAPADWTELGTMLNGNVHPSSGASASSGSWASNNNPKAIRFLEFKTNTFNSAGAYVDPWGNPYMVLTDGGGSAVGKTGWNDTGASYAEDGMVPHPKDSIAASNLQTTVAIFSKGADGVDQYTVGADPNPEVNGDDIYSWKE